MIPEEIISEIRSRADIVQVIGQHVQLKKAGRNWKGLCPFHGEKTPSFNVSPDKGFFYCFGCQKKGDVFTFLMELEGKSFIEAAEQLGGRFGIEIPRVEESPELRKARGERVAMLDINKLAAQFFREVLSDAKRGETGRAYLTRRGVGDEITDKFQLGYAPPDWHALTDFLKAKRADMEIAAKLGLVAKQPRAGGYYDRYRDRLVCPVIVPGGDVVGFSARVIGSIKPPAPPAADGSEPPKYINSPESSVYKKSKLLFGLAQAREGMQQTGRAVLVEGNFDVITLHQAGFTEVIAPLGTALTLDQVLTLKRLADRVVLLYDGDKAGYKATMVALEICVEADVEVQVAARPGHGRSGGSGVLSDGIDPDSLVAGGGAELLREAVKNAKGGIEFFAWEVWGKARGNADAMARAVDHAGKLLAKIENQTKREMNIDQLAKALGVDVAVVRGAIVRASGRGGSAPIARHPNAPSGGPAEPRETPVSLPYEAVELLSLLADHPHLLTTPDAQRAFSLLTEPLSQAIYSAARGGQSLLELAPVLLPSTTARLVLSGKYAEAKDPSAVLSQMTRDLETRKQRLGMRELQQLMLEAQRQGDRDRARKIAMLVEALRKGDQELADQLTAEISSNKKAE